MIDHSDDARDDALSALLRASAPDKFGAGFADRVLTRVRAEEASLAATLQRQFVRIVPLAAAAALLLASLNWWNARSAHTSAIDAALNLPQVSIATAYASTAYYDNPDAPIGMP
jgi:hypothetical protein